MSGTRTIEAPGVLMHAAAEVARVAGAVALKHYRSAGLRVEAKGDGSPVTAADREAETAARALIERRFPKDGILGEEFGLARQLCRKTKITRTTSTIASSNVFTTSQIDSLMKSVVSLA